MTYSEYDRAKAVEYAHKWALAFNPQYTNFEKMGGDCTNFASQCIFAGCDVMNYTPNFGWYYVSINERSPSWTGVEFLRNFLVNNKGVGPCASQLPIAKTMPGDIIQMSFDGVTFKHSLVVVAVGETLAPESILISAHTYNSDNRLLSSYNYSLLRLLHITGVRK